MALKLKLDEQGHAVLQDGKPVYVDDTDNKEYPLDGAHLYGRVRELTAENANHRKAREEAETAIKPFQGLDPEKARQAIETVANIDAKKLIDAGQVEEIKRQAREAAQAEVAAAQKEAKDQIDAITKERDTIQGQLHSELIGGGFARSKFIAEKVDVPADLLQATFGPNFKIEEGRVVGYLNGQKIVSPEDFVSPAPFDVALEKMVDAYPHKDRILKATEQRGGGGSEGGGDRGKSTFSKGDMGGTRKDRVEAIRSRFPDLGKAS